MTTVQIVPVDLLLEIEKENRSRPFVQLEIPKPMPEIREEPKREETYVEIDMNEDEQEGDSSDRGVTIISMV